MSDGILTAHCHLPIRRQPAAVCRRLSATTAEITMRIARRLRDWRRSHQDVCLCKSKSLHFHRARRLSRDDTNRLLMVGRGWSLEVLSPLHFAITVLPQPHLPLSPALPIYLISLQSHQSKPNQNDQTSPNHIWHFYPLSLCHSVPSFQLFPFAHQSKQDPIYNRHDLIQDR